MSHFEDHKKNDLLFQVVNELTERFDNAKYNKEKLQYLAILSHASDEIIGDEIILKGREIMRVRFKSWFFLGIYSQDLTMEIIEPLSNIFCQG